MRAALGGETAVHDRERALGVGAVDRGGQREVGAQPVVAHAVVELDVHPQEPLAGAQLERGHDLGGDAFVAARACTTRSSPIARAGQRYVAVDHDPGPHRTRLGHGRPSTDSGRSTTVSSAGGE